MPLTERDNFMRNASLRGHEWIPQHVSISGGYWHEMREDVEKVCLRHPVLFPGLEKGQVDFDGEVRSPEERVVKDQWGCTWDYELSGLDGIVVGHALEEWDALDEWEPPEPPQFTDEERQALQQARDRGEVASFGTEHGFLFMRLFYLRGYANFMADVASQDPRLDHLVGLIGDYWQKTIWPYVEAGLDVLATADDLGTQTASMLGPRHFRRWLMPTYRRLFWPARHSGAHVSMHHDGYIMDIMDEIIQSGVSIINPQDLVNGIDNLAREVKGRVCIRIDIDRQKVVPHGSPGDVQDLIREEVLKLGSPAGGLEMVVGIYPPTPLENVEAVFSALEEHRTYWAGR